MYYRNCSSLRKCNELIRKYWNNGQYRLCFLGHLAIAREGYSLAECQVGYFYYSGIGCSKNLEKSFYWTYRASLHGDRDAQFNLASFFEDGVVVRKNISKAKFWYALSAIQGQNEALLKIEEI